MATLMSAIWFGTYCTKLTRPEMRSLAIPHTVFNVRPDNVLGEVWLIKLDYQRAEWFLSLETEP